MQRLGFSGSVFGLALMVALTAPAGAQQSDAKSADTQSSSTASSSSSSSDAKSTESKTTSADSAKDQGKSPSAAETSTKSADTAKEKAQSSSGKESKAEAKDQAASDKDNKADEAKPGTTAVGGDQPAPEKTSAKDAKNTKDNKKDQADKKNAKDKDEDSEVKVDPAKVVEVGSQKVDVKPGSKDDVNAVGNRDIGGRGLSNWFSTDYEIKVGASYAQQIDKQTRFITDPVVTEYVNRIGQNIVKNSDCKVPFTIKVIDTDEINAFALPGGFFYVNSGLILNADEEAEIAGVMAHETAHVCAHHAMREMTRLNYAQIGMVPVMIFVGGWTGYGIYEGSSLAIPITFMKFSRDFEAEADYLGIQYMYRAGYDPQAFISFFEKIQALEKRKPGAVAKVFADHPQTPARILHSQEEIARILPPRDDYTVSTSEFDDVKARLARIENKRRLNDSKEKKPSLRKTSSSGSGDSSGSGSSTSSSGSSSSGDDRPTLHRRDDQN